MSTVTLSIIIPTLNEAAHLGATLQPILGEPSVEIIVVDGGSQDETVAIAHSYGVKTLISPPGRGQQMNLGATVAQGEILLFLHADTRLPKQFLSLIQTVLSQPGILAGAFTLKIDGHLAGLRWIEKAVNWRSRFLQLPYGDQALFLRAATFAQMGKFATMPIMEDFEFVGRLKQRGTIALIDQPVITSARRWQKLGVWRTTGINQLIILGYWVGIPPVTLASWYRKPRPSQH